jgi:hypothetical protein
MGWVSSLLLESPVPPPLWLPAGNARRAQARSIVRRVFEQRARHQAWHPGHYLHDLGSAYPFFGGGRFVSGDEIETELESELTHLNPPVFQGWGLVFVVAISFLLLFVLRDAAYASDGEQLPIAIGGLLACLVVWAGFEVLVGRLERELELCEHGVAVRRWTDVWFHRPGSVLDDPGVLEATVTGDELTLVGPSGSVAVSLRIWPPSARDGLHDELEAWGIVFGHRHEQHHHVRRRHIRR